MLFGANLKDALAKYTGKKDESVTSTTPEKPSQSGANEAQEKEKQKENLKINEATKLLVAINSEEGTPDAQKSQMAKFLSDRSFRSLPLSAIGPEFLPFASTSLSTSSMMAMAALSPCLNPSLIIRT